MTCNLPMLTCFTCIPELLLVLDCMNGAMDRNIMENGREGKNTVMDITLGPAGAHTQGNGEKDTCR